MAHLGDTIYGQNGLFYKQQLGWGILDSRKNPVNDCHEMVFDNSGQLYVLTNETANNILIYHQSGDLLGYWGHGFPGGHGLSIADEGGSEFLFVTDTKLHKVFKMSLSGEIIMTIDCPMETGLYKREEEFIPTETAITQDGDFYVVDGYGKQYVLHYGHDGRLKGWFGGKGPEVWHLDNAHGICVDNRNEMPTLLVTDRTKCCFKRFSLTGVFLEVIAIPGACVCRPVIHRDMIFAAVLRSPNMEVMDSGFVVVLDADNQVVSSIGGTAPVYQDGQLLAMCQEIPLFKHPHDVCIDAEENLYVAQWSSGRLYPYKFIRV